MSAVDQNRCRAGRVVRALVASAVLAPLLTLGGRAAVAAPVMPTVLTVTSDPASPITYDPTPAGNFTLTASIDGVHPNQQADVIFYRYDNPDEVVLDTVTVTSDASGHLTATSGPIPQPGPGTFEYFADMVMHAPVLIAARSHLTPISFVGQTTTTAQPAFRLLPRFGAHVEATAPATGVPTGTVDFVVAGRTVCSATLDSDGDAGCSPGLGIVLAADHYTAVYRGSDSFRGSQDRAPFRP